MPLKCSDFAKDADAVAKWLAELEAEGYQVVARAEAAGVNIRGVDASFARPLFDLELANYADYPYPPVTYQPPPIPATIEEFWATGKRVFGALVNGRLIGAVVGSATSSEARVCGVSGELVSQLARTSPPVASKQCQV